MTAQKQGISYIKCFTHKITPSYPKLVNNFNTKRIILMKIHFAYYNQFKNGINIAFADATIRLLSCADAKKPQNHTKFSKAN